MTERLKYAILKYRGKIPEAIQKGVVVTITITFNDQEGFVVSVKDGDEKLVYKETSQVWSKVLEATDRLGRKYLTVN